MPPARVAVFGLQLRLPLLPPLLDRPPVLNTLSRAGRTKYSHQDEFPHENFHSICGIINPGNISTRACSPLSPPPSLS
jgi:hypothetical protein